jgi:eukaryotic-like serine/threonine-protein kinase
MSAPRHPPSATSTLDSTHYTWIDRVNGSLHTGSGDIVFKLFADPQAKQRNRQRMLERLKRSWIRGVLEQSLHKAVLIQLHKQDEPGAVERRPWNMFLERGADSYPIPAEKPIMATFDEVGKALLILGPPGSGKTITMLELCRDCIRLAEADPLQPIPVVFNLSSWARRQGNFREWILDELNLKYQIPRKVGREWVENNELLLLLDGMDEVKEEKRDACAEAINEFRNTDYGLTDIVVSSRTEEYDALSHKLTLNTAIVIRPLDSDQVHRYLAALGPEMSYLLKALDEDEGLRKLAESPLMLSVLALAYRDLDLGPMAGGFPLEERRNRIFESYVERMFRRPERSLGGQQYAPRRTVQVLTRIARAMSQHGQSELFIEDIQPTWLSDADRLPYSVLIRLAGALMMILGTVLLDLLDIFWLEHKSFHFAIRQGLIFGFAFAVAFLLASLLRLRFRWPLTWALSVLPGSLVIILFQPIPVSHFSSLIGAGVFTFPFALAGTWVAKTENTIKLVEVRPWSRASLARMFRQKGRSWAGIVLFCSVLSLLLTYLTRSAGHPHGVEAPLGNALWYVVSRVLLNVFSLFAGIAATSALLSREVPDLRTEPSQGIRRSLKSAAFVGTAVTILVFASLYFLLQGPERFPVACEIAASLGLLAAFFLGGGAPCIQHVILRLVLAYKGYVPWNLKRFLDHCVERIFLRRAGGGYLFIHRMFLDYFAGLAAAGGFDANRGQWKEVAKRGTTSGGVHKRRQKGA